MDYLVNSIALSTNFPPSVLLGSKMGGADSRRDIASAARTVEQWQGDLIPDMARIYVHALEPEVESGALQNAPADWKSAISWQTPKSISVDYGREAQQDREDIKLGLGTRREYFGRWGQDWREEEAQTDVEARSLIDRAKKIADEKSVSFEVALKMLSDRGIEPQMQPLPEKETKPSSDNKQETAQQQPVVEDIQKLALNGAQLAAVQELIQQVANKQLPGEAAKRALYIALPNTPPSDIDAMVDAAAAFKPEPPPQQEQPPAT